MELEFEKGETLITEKGVTIDINRKGLMVGILYLDRESYENINKHDTITIK